ncbi:hypothetical protein ElyMa_000834500 [Elysia marginata]|uniref:Secreted protein n=1 Tax=Elysia marginata TaxID=1093978 RepID=A0AAV4GZ77_9GAST|nr:hypothetical protein ElyMa_000834500 [Elysia marginata]
MNVRACHRDRACSFLRLLILSLNFNVAKTVATVRAWLLSVIGELGRENEERRSGAGVEKRARRRLTEREREREQRRAYSRDIHAELLDTEFLLVQG